MVFAMRRLVLLLALLAAVCSAAEGDPDPCLEHDYAQENCVLPSAAGAASSRPITCAWVQLSEIPENILTVAMPCADGTCCAQGGYKLPGHDAVCKIVGPRVKAKREL